MNYNKKMGTVSSVSRDINNRINVSQDESSEYGFKTLNSIKNINNNYQSQGQNETAENTKIELNEKIPYKFEWKEGGNEVKISGSFLDDWKKKEELKKNLTTGVYEITIKIPKGIHQFKFIVDDKWLCSKNYNIIYDEMNNANNIIDLTNYKLSNINENNINMQTKKKKKKSGKDNIEYSRYFPNANEVNLEAPIVPMHYIPSFNLNSQTNQESLKKYIKPITLDKRRNIIENNIYKTIITISHEKLSHLCFNLENSNNNEKYIRTSMSQRNKHKFITLVYYSPKK